MAEDAICLFCDGNANLTTDRAGGLPVYWYNSACCPPFVVISPEQTYFGSQPYSEKETQVRVKSLIRERQLTSKDRAFLQFERDKPYPDISGTYGVYVPDLLDGWPDSVELRIERSLLNLARLFPRAGHVFEQKSIPHVDALFFSIDAKERSYYLTALEEHEWILRTHGKVNTEITPQGWKKVEALRSGRAAAENPVFVAMWFGGKEQEQQMISLYEDAFKPAIQQCGYKATRSDMEEHNDDAMDRIRARIRSAPFVVADLTEPNAGVYYEAGLASGRGTTVIHCCPADKVDGVHFDLKTRQLVRYKDLEDLRRRLVNRIEADFEPGPYPMDQQ